MPDSAKSRPAPVFTRRPRARRFLTALLVIVVLGLCAGAGVFATALYATRDQKGSRAANAARYLIEEVVGPDLIFDGRNRVNVLLIGEDLAINQHGIRVKEYSRSDTNILFSLDRTARTAHVLSLPRDTKADVPGQGVHKLNAAHRLGGPALLVQTIYENFGLHVDRYVKTNFHGFIVLVDLVGGIDVDVERDMDYDDNWQNFHVHLKKGPQHLDGKGAHGYVRWRKSNNGQVDPKGDLGRIERQQKVIKLLARKALAPQNLPRLRQIMAAARKYIETDLSDRQLMSMLLFLSKLDPSMLDTGTLPGEARGPFVEVNREEAAVLLARMFGAGFDESKLMARRHAENGKRSRTQIKEPHPAKVRELDDDDDDEARPAKASRRPAGEPGDKAPAAKAEKTPPAPKAKAGEGKPAAKAAAPAAGKASRRPDAGGEKNDEPGAPAAKPGVATDKSATPPAPERQSDATPN